MRSRLQKRTFLKQGIFFPAVVRLPARLAVSPTSHHSAGPPPRSSRGRRLLETRHEPLEAVVTAQAYTPYLPTSSAGEAVLSLPQQIVVLFFQDATMADKRNQGYWT